MHKTILRVLLLIFSFVTLGFSYTATYKCLDKKDGYELLVNIDENSLYYGGGKQFYVFDYVKTAKAKNNTLFHVFSKGNIDYRVYQAPSNPIKIDIDDYKDNKIRYEYKCTLSDSLKANSTIPVTWRSIKDKEKLLKKVAKPIHKKGGDIIEKQKFYEENLDMYAFCAANYFVRTTTPKEQKALSKIIQSYGMTSQYIGSLYFSKLYKKTASKGTIFKYREKYLLLLEKDFRDDRKLSKDTLQKIAQCDGKIVYLSNNLSVYNNIDKVFVYSEKSDKLFHDELAITTQKPAKIDEKRILESFKI